MGSEGLTLVSASVETCVPGKEVQATWVQVVPWTHKSGNPHSILSFWFNGEEAGEIIAPVLPASTNVLCFLDHLWL